LKKEINEQLFIIKNIRKEMIFFMDIQERELAKSDFAKLIKDISCLNKAIPNESIVNKKIVQISK